VLQLLDLAQDVLLDGVRQRHVVRGKDELHVSSRLASSVGVFNLRPAPTPKD
jgi:hypothetical protein